MYKDTITLFNYFESKQTDTYLWFPTVLHNVDLNLDKAAILAKTGEKSQDNAILHVRIQNGSKPWIPPIEWGKQVRDDLRETLTFKSGDFFWHGEWPGTDPINNDDYLEGFDDYMVKKYDYVFRITSVDGPFTVIPHLEILGR